MRYCENCHIHIENPRESCPLCQNQLSSAASSEKLTEAFPAMESSFIKYKLLFQFLAFFSLIAGVGSLIVNLFFRNTGWWSSIILAAIAYFWIAVVNLIRTKNSLGSIARSAIILSVLLFLLDFLYGFSRWSVNYAIPALLVSGIIAVVTISIARGQDFADFVLYVLITSVSALLCFILLLTGVSTILWPSLVCSLCGFLSLIGIFIFADRNTIDEFKRRFHL